jgi:hypothetical protein
VTFQKVQPPLSKKLPPCLARPHNGNMGPCKGNMDCSLLLLSSSARPAECAQQRTELNITLQSVPVNSTCANTADPNTCWGVACCILI